MASLHCPLTRMSAGTRSRDRERMSRDMKRRDMKRREKRSRGRV